MMKTKMSSGIKTSMGWKTSMCDIILKKTSGLHSLIIYNNFSVMFSLSSKVGI